MSGVQTPSIDFDAFIFDLDGTLLDTADDLGGALNRVLADANSPCASSFLTTTLQILLCTVNALRV